MSEHRSRIRRPLALALAAGALAVGAPAAMAVANGGDGDSVGTGSAPAAVEQQSRTVQENQQQPDRTTPRGEDCPEREGGDSGTNGGAQGSGSASEDPAEL